MGGIYIVGEVDDLRRYGLKNEEHERDNAYLCIWACNVMLIRIRVRDKRSRGLGDFSLAQLILLIVYDKKVLREIT